MSKVLFFMIWLVFLTVINSEPITYIFESTARGNPDEQIVVDTGSGEIQNVANDAFILSVFADTELIEDGGFVDDGNSIFSGLVATIKFASIAEVFTFDELFTIELNDLNNLAGAIFLSNSQSDFESFIAAGIIGDGDTLNPFGQTGSDGFVFVENALANNGTKRISIGSRQFVGLENTIEATISVVPEPSTYLLLLSISLISFFRCFCIKTKQ